MKGYVVCVYNNISNKEKLREYAIKAKSAVEKYKGKFLMFQKYYSLLLLCLFYGPEQTFLELLTLRTDFEKRIKTNSRFSNIMEMATMYKKIQNRTKSKISYINILRSAISYGLPSYQKL